LVPNLGHLKIQQVQPTHIDKLLADMQKDGLTANTARHAFVVLQKALKDAERRGVIEANPCRRVDPPKVIEFIAEPPTKSELEAILSNVRSKAHRTAFTLIAATGLRRGEAAALSWSSIDLELKWLSVVQATHRVSSGIVELMPPKTASSRRGVALDQSTVGMLREHRASQQERILASYGAIADHGYVFPNKFGEIIDPDSLTREWRKAAHEAGYPQFRLLDLRHYHATTLVSLGVHAKVIQERLGHSTPAFTLARYSHVSSGMQTVAASLYDKHVNPAT